MHTIAVSNDLVWLPRRIEVRSHERRQFRSGAGHEEHREQQQHDEYRPGQPMRIFYRRRGVHGARHNSGKSR